MGLPEEVLIHLRSLFAKIPNWCRAFVKGCKLEEERVRCRNEAQQLTKDDVHKYRNCSYALEAEKILSNGNSPGFVPTKAQYVKARNHAIGLISLGNAPRAGVLCNFTMEEYYNALGAPPRADQSIVFTVFDHKTTYSYGPATVLVNTREVNLLADFLILRNKFFAASAQRPLQKYFFLNSNGS